MIRMLRGRLRPVLLAGVGILLLGAVAASVVVGIRVLGDLGWQGLFAAAVALAAVVVLLVVPVHWLPAVAAVAFCLLPLRLVPSDGPFNSLPPLSLILMVWAFRRIILNQSGPVDGPAPLVERAGGRFAVWAIGGVLLLWLLFSAFRSDELDTSIGWIVSMTVGAFCVLVVPDARAEVALLRPALLWSLGILAGYATIELLLQSSPLYSTIYSVVGVSDDQPWAVYRSTASFGHPLFAGAMFSLGAGLGIGGWLSGAPKRHLVLGALCAVGVVATVSRGSILATGIAGAIAVLGALIIPGPHRDVRVLLAGLLGGVALLLVLNFAPLQERESSTESQVSSGARDTAVWVALQAAENTGWLGAGPGMSGIEGRKIFDVIIENSMLQLLVSIGVPGLLLFLAMLGAAAGIALRRRDLGAVAAMAGYIVAITGFNSIDALRSMHLIIGLLLLLALHPVAGIGILPASRRRTGRLTPRRGPHARPPAGEPQPDVAETRRAVRRPGAGRTGTLQPTPVVPAPAEPTPGRIGVPV